MSRRCSGHQLIRQPKIQMSLIKAIPIIAAVIPGAVRLIPLSVQLHGIPGVSIIGIPCLAVFYSCCSKELCICTLIRLTGAKPSGQRTLRVLSYSSWSSSQSCSQRAFAYSEPSVLLLHSATADRTIKSTLGYLSSDTLILKFTSK